MTQNTHTLSSDLIIASTSIKQDGYGRYCLNDCHRAAGAPAAKRPANFMRLDTTKALIEEIAGSPQSSDMSIGSSQPISTVRGGNEPGTYAVKELVYAYAMWINPAFYLTVLRVFDAVVRGALPAAPALPPKQRKPSLLTTFQTGLKMASLMGLDDSKAHQAAAHYCESQGLDNPLSLMGIKKEHPSLGISHTEVIFWFFQGLTGDDVQYFTAGKVPTNYRSLARDECTRRGLTTRGRS